MIVYIYFQIPLMVLVMLPAVDGLKPEWREAAANLGGTAVTYWRRVGIPVLTPAALGGMLLLFANAFAAYATAFALTTGSRVSSRCRSASTSRATPSPARRVLATRSPPG